MSREIISIHGVEIRCGQKKKVDVPLPSLYDCSPVSLPVHVIRGKESGPTLCVTAAIHGDEISGVEIVRRLIAKKRLCGMRGTLIAVPVVNVYGFLLRDRYLPDGRDLNRCFPGSSTGSLASRVAHILSQKVLALADYHIDLHSGSSDRSNLPQIRINGDTEEELRLAKAFNAPVILTAKERDGSLRQMHRKKGRAALVYEAGEAHRFSEMGIRAGVDGVMNVMQEIQMLSPSKRTRQPKASESYLAQSSFWVRSLHSGVFTALKAIGKKVKEGETIARVGNPFGCEQHNIVSPKSGIVIGINKLPLVQEGAALQHIACFEKLSQVEHEIQEFTDEHSRKVSSQPNIA